MKLLPKQRLLSVILAVCLISGQSLLPVSAYGDVPDEDGYILVENCIHEHGPDCYPEDEDDGDGSEEEATPSDAKHREATECSHVCSEENGCITKVFSPERTRMERSGQVEIDGVEYTDQGDFTTKSLDLSGSPAGNNIYYAGDGYVLWEEAEKLVTLHDASVTASYALEVPSGARIVVEGSSTLTGTNSYALVCYSGGIAITGPGSLTAVNQVNSSGWTYAIHAGDGSLSVDIGGNLITGDDSSGGIQAQNGSIAINSGSAVSINGLVRAGGTVSVEAQTSISITNDKNMAIQSINGGDVSLTAGLGDITVSGGNTYNPYSIQGNSGVVTLDAAGEVLVSGYNAYPGVNGSRLNLSGKIPEGATLHSSCDVTVPDGKTLTNHGTLFVNSGVVTVAGTLVKGSTASIESGNGDITPETTGNGAVTDDSGEQPDPGPVVVSTLDLRSNAPETETEYRITTGGTAIWEPGSDGEVNRLTLDGVNMTGNSMIVAVPENTEIILKGTNIIHATDGDGIYVPGGTLTMSGDGSLNIEASRYGLYGEGGIDVSISGAISVTGQIRAGNGAVSVESGDAITVNGSVFGRDRIGMEAGTSLSVVNPKGAGFFATGCTDVSLAARDGDLTVTGTDHYAIYGNSTEIDLSASGDLYISGCGDNPYSVEGTKLNLSGTIPENITLYANCDVTVPTGRTLTNDGTLHMYRTSATITVDGTLHNRGVILNGAGIVKPEGGGAFEEKGDLDFTKAGTAASGAGYSWDSQTKTLTLDGFDNRESDVSGMAIVLPEGAKLILVGDNQVTSQNNTVIKAMGDLEISGDGSLTGVTGGGVAFSGEGAVTIRDCTVSFTTTSDLVKSAVIETNGNGLVIDGTAKVTCKTESGTDSGWGIHTGTGALTIGEKAAVTIDGAGVGILINSDTIGVDSDIEVKIYGELDTTGCPLMCANLLGVRLDMEGSRIAMKEGTHIWLYQGGQTLTGETDLREFSGCLRVAGPDGIKDYYEVAFDSQIGLHAEGSTVSFTADVVDGKTFIGWTATGVTLSDESSAAISFIMPGNGVVLKANYKIPVGGVRLEVSELSLKSGDTVALKAVVWPEDASNRDVTWSIDRTEIAEVDENGIVTAKKGGTAIITVTTVDGGKTAFCNLTVHEAARPVIPGDTVRYMVEHYKADTADNTSYVLADTEYLAGTIGETVKAVPRTYTGYTYNADKSISGSTLKAIDSGDDIVILKLYYDVTRSGGDNPGEDNPGGDNPGEDNSDEDSSDEDGFDGAGSGYQNTSNSDTGLPYIDVKTTDWFYEAVKFVHDTALMAGVQATVFGPHGNSTRAQLAAVLYGMAGSPRVEAGSYFTDVKYEPGTIWYHNAVTWVWQNKLMEGYEHGTFKPDNPMTREQLVLLFYNYAKYKGYDVTAVGSFDRFTDQDRVSAETREAMRWAVGKGIIDGRDNGLLDPQGTVSRGEAADILRRFIEKNDLVQAAPAADGKDGMTGWIKRPAGLR